MTSSDLIEADIGSEEWREYDFGGRSYRILNPVKLYFRPTGTTHRVLDPNGLMHCVPAPGISGCVLRWQPRDPNSPVAF